MLIFTLLSIIPSFLPNSSAGEIISTNFGRVEGSTATSRDGRMFHKFLGIPYAKAERFQPPTDPEPWTDIKNATAYGPMCPQMLVTIEDSNFNLFIGSEDCLHLNIFTPMLPQSDKAKVLLPVMVWFHGGDGKVDGSVNYDPQYYMDTDIVVVTFDARLGFLGYLNLGNELASGNQRLKDQVLMLKWVQKNIENFGGDPTRVTLNGFDSGAAEVSYHMLSPMSKGLFAGAISQCGSHLMPQMFIRNPIYQAKRFGAKVGCPVESKEGLYECLKGKRPQELVLSFYRWHGEVTDEEFLKVGPSMEYSSTENAFMVENPFISLEEGRISNKVPWISLLSLNSGFGAYISKILRSPALQQKFNSNVFKILPRYLDYEFTAKDPDAVTNKIMQHYFNGKVNATNAYELVNLATYRHYTQPGVRSGDFYPAHAPVYTIMNKYVPLESISKVFGYDGVVEGAYGDEVSYQFPWTTFYHGINTTSKDYALSKKFIQLLVSFMENGKPTKTWGDIKNWLPYHPVKRGGVTIDKDGQMIAHSISQEYIKSHVLWAPMFKNELVAEFQNLESETF